MGRRVLGRRDTALRENETVGETAASALPGEEKVLWPYAADSVARNQLIASAYIREVAK
jgi:hypothetical protein